MSSRRNSQSVNVDTRQRIGPAIRNLRQQQHLSLSDLADQTGISVSYLSRLEKGKSVPSFTLLYRLAQVLGVDIGFFVETERTATEIDQRLEQALGRTSIPRQVWPEFFGLSLQTREALLNFLEQQNPPEKAAGTDGASNEQGSSSGGQRRSA